jgi:hypothetical protein
LRAHNALGNGSDDDSDGVANEIGPQESETKHQSAQRCVANAVDPGSVVQLADLDEKRRNQRHRRSRNHCSVSEQSTHQQKQHQCPKRIAGVLTNESWQDGLISTRCKANDHDRDRAQKECDAGPDQFWLTPEYRRSKDLRKDLQTVAADELPQCCSVFSNLGNPDGRTQGADLLRALQLLWYR